MLTAFPTGPAEFDHPDSMKQTPTISRRVVLGLLAAAPVLTALPSLSAPDRLVVHQGWVLLASDLERLGLK
jgi:hypothetical protein